MSARITEPTLYPHIRELLKNLAKQHGVNVIPEPEISMERQRPDLFVKIDGNLILIQVKIDSLETLLEDIAKSYPLMMKHGAGLISILFREEVRKIHPEILEKVINNLEIRRGLVLTPWATGSFEDTKLADFLNYVVEKYVDFVKTKVPYVDYLTVARVARETVESLAVELRNFMGIENYRNEALAIIGRFDVYRGMLRDIQENEEQVRMYIADIIAYIFILQLLFLHLISKKIYHDRALLPKPINPINPPDDLIDQLINAVITNINIIKEYDVLDTLPHILRLIQNMSRDRPTIKYIIAKFLTALYSLRPEDIKAEFFGRVYQLTLPHETRRNLGAFFTRPEAARLLAELTIERYDDEVLDPACGSGTLLVEAYQAKMRRAKEQGLNVEELHKLFLEKHIVGIDIMQFARELTAINLMLQNPIVKAKPRVYAGDGISKMFRAKKVNDDPPNMSIEDFIGEFVAKRHNEYEILELPFEGFEAVIMNPPFTRRENIPEDIREELNRLLGDIVRGKVGYWAYFFAAADNVIKPGGVLAAVTPEEFFAGKSAESVRRFLFLGEVYDKESKNYIKKLGRIYRPKIIIKSSVETAFSEGAHYRDYLMILKKIPESQSDPEPSVIIILKKPIRELSDNELKVTEKIREFRKSDSDFISTEYFDAVKIYNMDSLISRYIGNLKPIVGPLCVGTQKIISELLDELSQHPTLGNYEIRAYNPGQYHTKGVEDYARRLFAYRYRAVGKTTFRIVKVDEDSKQYLLEYVRGRRPTFSISFNSCVPALRSPVGVLRFDITGWEECAIINVNNIPPNIRQLAGLLNYDDLLRAANDVREAYNDIASNLLIARRIRLTSPNLYWLAFYSDNRTLNTAVLLNVLTHDMDRDSIKLLTLYLNSSIALLQLLAFRIETEGGWVDLHGDQVWSYVHIPDLARLPNDVRKDALDIFEKLGKRESVNSLSNRIRQGNDLQRSIDEISLRMLGLDYWITRLNEIYNAISCELNRLDEILNRDGSNEELRREKSHDENKNRRNEKRKKRGGSSLITSFL
jgi:SAM-dependent methyltransferase